MSNDKVKCQCCGKMMVPRVVFSRGWYIGWGVRVGGGRPKSNCCPFCLSENWREQPSQKGISTIHKALLILFLFLTVRGIVGAIQIFGPRFFDDEFMRNEAGFLMVALYIMIYPCYKIICMKIHSRNTPAASSE